MSDDTARLHLPQLVSLQELNAVTWNEALEQIDALVDLCLLGQFVNTPPSSPQDGDAYLTGGAPTGAWSGYAYKIASCRDGAWRFYTPYNGLRAFVAPSNTVIVYCNGNWTTVGSTDFATKSGSETLANKTLSSASLSGTTSFPGGGAIGSSGAVGIGTASPAGRLTVYDTVGVGGTPSFNVSSNKTSQTIFRIDNTTSRNWEFGVGGSSSSIGNGFFYFFDTTAQAARLIFDTSGNALVGANVVPASANARNLGSASLYWANGYIQNAWTVISDERLKDEIASLSEAEMAVAKEIAPLVATYKMKSAIAGKGSLARRHCGWIAQRIEAIFAAHGLDPFAYGCVGFDPAIKTVARTRTVMRPKLEGSEPVVDADGKPVMETVEETYEEQVPDCDDDGVQRMIHNLRIAEVTAFAVAGLAARIAVLEAACGHA